MFEPVPSKVSLPQEEERILALWEEEKTFEASLAQRRDADEYVFYDGPPFATGLPHYGHLLAGTIKDIVPRYHAMRGHYVERRFGWDCHGLPIEALAQEALGLAGTGAIKEAGIDVFNEQCRSMVLTYVSEWRKTVTRMGRWVDFDNDYKTMDPSFMESIWWVFKQLWEQNRVYKAYRIMPYSWKLTTPLSNFEAGNNYKDVQDPAITVRLRITGRHGAESPMYALAWTTTPWTLPENLALCAGPQIDYVAVQDGTSGDVYLLAEARLAAYYKSEEEYEILERFKGSELVGWTYEPLFPYFADHPNSFRIVQDAFVSTQDGTGIVHLAPAYGEDDYRVCTREGIELIDPLDDECKFTSALPDYEGLFCKDADKDLVKRLKQEGKLVHQSTIQHSYPFCERTETPLIYRAIDAWYVKVEDLRDELVANNEQVHWVPDYVGEKRFGNWLKEAKDWNVSRNRFWGSCIPVWVSEDGADMICMGSMEELERFSGERVTDLHKHVLDKIVFDHNGKTYRRTPEVLDCWFESGAMPYAQCHYPFENKERFETHFPADFIAEGLDQTRGWFYTLMVLSTALFKRPAYRNVVVNGMVLAEDGRKMSKRLKNYPDPMEMVNAYGADAIRLHLITSPAVRGENLCLSEEGIKHSMRHLLIPWWNAYSFFVTYANVDQWEPSGTQPEPSENVLDRWVLSSLERLTEEVVVAMDGYDLQRAGQPFMTFIEDLTNWYIRRSRRRFWKSTDDGDKQQAYATLYEVLLRLSKIAAPSLPFFSEVVYRNLRTDEMPTSVHLCDFPVSSGKRDLVLETEMADVMAIVGMGRVLRSEYELKVRQPLAGLHVVCHDASRLTHIKELADVIADELNLRDVWFSTDESKLADLKAKADYRKLGPKLGPKMRSFATAIQGLSGEQCTTLLAGNSVNVTVDGDVATLDPGDVEVVRIPREGLAVSAEGHLVVALDIELTEELLREGLARELVNKVQNMRKTSGLEVTDRIVVEFAAGAEVQSAVTAHQAYVKAETLAKAVTGTPELTGEAEPWDLNGFPCKIAIRLAN